MLVAIAWIWKKVNRIAWAEFCIQADLQVCIQLRAPDVRMRKKCININMNYSAKSVAIESRQRTGRDRQESAQNARTVRIRLRA